MQPMGMSALQCRLQGPFAAKGISTAEAWRMYRAQIRLTDPEKYRQNKMKNALRMRRKREEVKTRRHLDKNL